MKSPITIPRSGPQDLCSNYQALLQKGIEYCQNLSGDLWTDYNQHDPGVTILQQLCYAITDLAYRTDFTIADILTPQPDTAAADNTSNDTLFTGDKILTSNPVTPADYQKLLYDQVLGLENARLVQIEDHPLGIKGLYEVQVETREDFEDKGDVVAQRVRECMRSTRNLAEDVERVTILQPQLVGVDATVEIRSSANPVTILAQILFDIQNYLIPYPRVQLVEDEIAKGRQPDEIWNGPLLQLGALEQSPRPRKDSVDVQDIANVILKVRGVKRVKHLMFRCPPEGGPKTNFKIEKGRVPRLYPLILKPQPSYAINIELEGDVKWQVDAAAVWARIQELYARVRNRIANAFRSAQKLSYGQVPSGKYKDLDNYFSVQHQFPVVYGLSQYGTGDSLVEGLALYPKKERQARVQQLKGYLLFFEQLLANYLAQLSHVPDLFSLDEKIDQTYFGQPVAPQRAKASEPLRIADVLVQQRLISEKEEIEAEFEGKNVNRTAGLIPRGASRAFPIHGWGGMGHNGKDPLEAYRKNLEALEQQDNSNYLSGDFLSRRNKFLNHLLARFGERFDDDILLQLDVRPFGKKDDFYRELIHWKIEFLRKYIKSLCHENGSTVHAGHGAGAVPSEGDLQDYEPGLGAGRGQGFDYGSADECRAASGLERRLSLLLGLNRHVDSGKYYPMQQKDTSGAGGTKEADQSGFAYVEKQVSALDPEHVPQKEPLYDVVRHHILGSRRHNEPDLADLYHHFIFSSEDSGILRHLLTFGLNPKNYVKRNIGPDEWQVLFRLPRSNQAIEVHSAIDEHQANQAIERLTRYLRELKTSPDRCYAGERLWVVEHVLLRPQREIKDRPVRISHPKGIHLSSPLIPEQRRNEHLKLILLHGQHRENYRIEKNIFGEIIVGLYCGQEQIACTESLISERHAENAISWFVELVPLVEQNDKLKEKHVHKHAHDTFYSHRVSVLLPNWPLRFQSNEFKLYMEQMVRENAPAHLGVTCFWLSAHAMNEFEQMYRAWKSLKRESLKQSHSEKQKPEGHLARLDTQSEKIKDFLQNLEREQKHWVKATTGMK